MKKMTPTEEMTEDSHKQRREEVYARKNFPKIFAIKISSIPDY